MPAFKLFFKQIVFHKIAILMYFTIFFIIFFVIASTSGTALKDLTFDETSMHIGLVDRDRSDASAALSAYLEKGNTVTKLADTDTAQKDFLYDTDTSALLVIPKGYEASLEAASPLPLGTKSGIGNATTRLLLNAKLDDFVGNVLLYMRTGTDVRDAFDQAEDLSTLHTKVTQVAADTYISQADMPNIYYYYRFAAYILILVTVSAVGPNIVSFYKKPLYMRTLCAGKKPLSFHLQIAFGILVFTCATYLLFGVISYLVGASSMSSPQFGYSLLNMGAFSVVCISLTCLCGFLSKDDTGISGLANTLGLVLAFLGGIFVPLEFLGDTLSRFAKLTPTYWYSTANDNIFSASAISSTRRDVIWQSIAMQLIMALAIFAVALLAGKKKMRYRTPG